MRSAIENTLYAYKVAIDSSAKSIWLARMTSKTAKNAVTNAFRPSEILNSLGTGGSPALAQVLRNLYDLTIDEGAHPNAPTFAKHSIQRNEPGSLALGLNYQDTDFIEACVDHIHEVGERCLELYAVVFPSWIW